jgi:hypothetical protein
MSTRDLHITGVIVGGKGTGKSTKLAEIASKYPENKKVLILDVNGSPAYNTFTQVDISKIKRLNRGVVRMMGTPDEETLKTIAKDFRNGLIIFEDCTKYIFGYVSPEIKTFLVDHRMYGCDLIFTFHSLKMIPPFFWQMISYVTISKTLENFINGQNRERVPNYEAIADAFQKVKASDDKYFSITVETGI